MIRALTVDMFGLNDHHGSRLDVLLLDGPSGAADAQRFAQYALASDADETAVITDVSGRGRSFLYQVFGANGQTPFTTHSLAGAAASLVSVGAVGPGWVTAHAGDGSRLVWTDGTSVRVPVTGAVVSEPTQIPADVLIGVGGRTCLAGLGRGFLLRYVDQDPLTLPVPDFAAMEAAGLTNLTFVQRLPETGQVCARVFAPGFGIPEDAGCLPAAAAIAAEELNNNRALQAVTVRQVTSRGTVSELLCDGQITDERGEITVVAQVKTAMPSTVSRPNAD